MKQVKPTFVRDNSDKNIYLTFSRYERSMLKVWQGSLLCITQSGRTIVAILSSAMSFCSTFVRAHDIVFDLTSVIGTVNVYVYHSPSFVFSFHFFCDTSFFLCFPFFLFSSFFFFTFFFFMNTAYHIIPFTLRVRDLLAWMPTLKPLRIFLKFSAFLRSVSGTENTLTVFHEVEWDNRKGASGVWH